MSTANELDLDRGTFYCQVERLDEQGQRYRVGEEQSIKSDAFPFFFVLWLELYQPFRVTAVAGPWKISYTVRLRRPKGRVRPVWYAEARIDGHLRQRYVGYASDISLLKLEQLVYHFRSFIQED